MNWDDPEQRLTLIERVGAERYNEMFAEHQKASTVAEVNGHAIRPVMTRFGRIYMVGGTDKGFSTLEQAKLFAEGQGNERDCQDHHQAD